ncbi:MAG: response regulator [Candidatus Kariarchaeaceae archaeon]|jgi:signal transduction histidine kinase
MANENNYEKNKIISSRIPLVIALLIIVLSTGFWIIDFRTSQNQLNTQSKDINNHLSNDIGSLIHQQINLVNTLLLDQWVSTNNDSKLFSYDRYLQIIPNFYNFYEGYQAINWINSTGVVKWIYPYDPNLGVLNQSIVRFVDGTLNPAFNHSLTTKTLGISPLIPLFQGGTGLATYIPIMSQGNLTGFFNVVFKIAPLINSYLSTYHIDDYSFYIYEGKAEVYHYQESFSRSDDFVKEGTISFYYRTWTLYLKPNKDILFRVSPFANILILIVGIIATILAFSFSRFILRQSIIMEEHYLEKENYEKMMWQYQKMDALGTLAGGMAHDFNNLLMGIQGNVSLLSDFVLEELKKHPSFDSTLINEMNEALTVIEQILQRSKDLTRQILAFSRHTETSFEVIDLLKNIQNVVLILNQTIDKRISIYLDFQISRAIVLSNNTKLSQIFMNLIINASDAILKVGRIDIIVDKIDITETQKIYDLEKVEPNIEFDKQEKIRIRIIDSGIGIKKEHLVHVFDPFFTTKNIGQGTGLGLPIAFRSVKSLNGDIEISSELGRGTEVTVYFPSVINHETSDLKKSEDTVDLEEKHQKEPFDSEFGILLKGMNFLIVEDEDSIRKSIKSYLERNNANVTESADGKMVFEHYKSNIKRYDLIILDINLPGINGIDLYQQIVNINPTQKVIFITGYSEQVIPIKSDEYAIVVEKPFSLKELVETLAKIIHI